MDKETPSADDDLPRIDAEDIELYVLDVRHVGEVFDYYVIPPGFELIGVIEWEE